MRAQQRPKLAHLHAPADEATQFERQPQELSARSRLSHAASELSLTIEKMCVSPHVAGVHQTQCGAMQSHTSVASENLGAVLRDAVDIGRSVLPLLAAMGLLAGIAANLTTSAVHLESSTPVVVYPSHSDIPGLVPDVSRLGR